jgi:DNA-binding LacI/PurR family transcriptional regulator
VKSKGFDPKSILTDFQATAIGSATLESQLADHLTWLIASGTLVTGQHLPSIREAARSLGINMHTVRSAYQRLEADGLVATRPASGTVVLTPDVLHLARKARRQRSNTVGIILPLVSNPFYGEFLQGVEPILQEHNILPFICDAYEDPQLALRYLAQLAAKRVDGVLLVSFDLNPALVLTPGREVPRLPVVTVDWPGAPGYSVELDLEQAGYLAVKHLIEHGHRRIATLGVAIDNPNILRVLAGSRRALAGNVPPLAETLVLAPGFEPGDGERAVQQILQMSPRPSALFAISDTLAIGAMQALKKASLQVPGDMALVGFNDIPLAGMVNPPLTTVAAPKQRMGTEAAAMLIRLIQGKKPAEQRIMLPVELVVRESCGCRSGGNMLNGT